MKKFTLSILLCCLGSLLYAAQTTYSFTTKDWGAKVGTIVTDGSTDGWLSLQGGRSFLNGYDTPQGITSRGVQITAKESGAGAKSVMQFTEVRKLIVNYCTNKKAGKGEIVVQIGDNDSIVMPIAAPSSNGDLNRDLEISLSTPQTGNIRFTINCTENSIYISQITIKASNASPSVGGLTKSAFQLVTDVSQLADSDEVMIGISDTEQNYVMGVFNDAISRNNIHALHATYSGDRNMLNEVSDAIYTLHILQDESGNMLYTLQDYTAWYLVASGGNPNKGNNNYLTAWDLADSPTYGRFGYWAISIAEDGAATLLNQGSSRSNLLQFNYNSGTPIFACYKDASQTSVALYRRISIPADDEPYIQPAFVNFGTALLTQDTLSGFTTIEINAINLTEEIHVSLKDGAVFHIDKDMLDRDGDHLSISYQVSSAGLYRDTIQLSSGSTITEVPILLKAENLLTIAQAQQLPEQTMCWLDEVVVTKKYDKYIFVQDETGSLLLFDGSNLYGKEISNGYRLTGVMGKMNNYYGNPSMNLAGQFTSQKGETCLPTEITNALTEDDACRYIIVHNAAFTEDMQCIIAGTPTPLYALFGALPNVEIGVLYDVVAIAYNYNGMVLCPISVTKTGSSIENTSSSDIVQWNSKTLLNPQHQQIDLYSVGGALIRSTQSDLDTSDMVDGVYIVQMGQRTIKLILQ